MKRLILLVCITCFFSCQDKVICPAFQSTYILDDSTRNAYFSYAWQLDEVNRAKFIALEKSMNNPDDTLNLVEQPQADYYAYAGEKVVPWRIQKKTKYGIIKSVPYPIKNYRLRTAPMENVLGPEPLDNFVGAEMLDTPPLDSTAIDSVVVKEQSVVAKDAPRFLYGYDPADNFNVEQEYYNKYFGDRMVDKRPIPESAPLDTLNTNTVDSLQTKQPFFKGLFKKKKADPIQNESDSLSAPAAVPIPEEGNGG